MREMISSGFCFESPRSKNLEILMKIQSDVEKRETLTFSYLSLRVSVWQTSLTSSNSFVFSIHPHPSIINHYFFVVYSLQGASMSRFERIYPFAICYARMSPFTNHRWSQKSALKIHRSYFIVSFLLKRWVFIDQSETKAEKKKSWKLIPCYTLKR